MSKDDRRRGDTVLTSMVQDSVEEPRSVVVDTTTATSADTPKIERRRRVDNLHRNRPSDSAYAKYIPAGYTPRLVNPHKDRPNKLYAEDWEFVKDENGNQITANVNSGKSAASTHHILMMKRTEWIEDDARAKVDSRHKFLNETPGISDEMKQQKFLHDIGVHSEKDIN